MWRYLGLVFLVCVSLGCGTGSQTELGEPSSSSLHVPKCSPEERLALDRSQGAWRRAATPNYPHAEGVAVTLPNGTALVAGGNDIAGAEVYDPGRDSWATTDPMYAARRWPTAS